MTLPFKALEKREFQKEIFSILCQRHDRGDSYIDIIDLKTMLLPTWKDYFINEGKLYFTAKKVLDGLYHKGLVSRKAHTSHVFFYKRKKDLPAQREVEQKLQTLTVFDPLWTRSLLYNYALDFEARLQSHIFYSVREFTGEYQRRTAHPEFPYFSPHDNNPGSLLYDTFAKELRNLAKNGILEKNNSHAYRIPIDKKL